MFDNKLYICYNLHKELIYEKYDNPILKEYFTMGLKLIIAKDAKV